MFTCANGGAEARDGSKNVVPEDLSGCRKALLCCIPELRVDSTDEEEHYLADEGLILEETENPVGNRIRSIRADEGNISGTSYYIVRNHGKAVGSGKEPPERAKL